MRKQAYFAIIGASVAVGAVSLGVMVTRYLGVRAYSPKAPPRAAVAVPQRTVAQEPPEQWNNLFAPAQGMKIASRLPSGGNAASRAVKTDFVLVGTIASSNPAARRAILWASGMTLPKAFREKEEVEPGAILSAVERDKVWLTRGKERQKLDLLPIGSKARGGSTAPQVAASTAPAVVPATGFSPAAAPVTPAAPPPYIPPPAMVRSPPVSDPGPASSRSIRRAREDEEEPAKEGPVRLRRFRGRLIETR